MMIGSHFDSLLGDELSQTYLNSFMFSLETVQFCCSNLVQTEVILGAYSNFTLPANFAMVMMISTINRSHLGSLLGSSVRNSLSPAKLDRAT